MNAELTSSRFPYVPIRWQVGKLIRQTPYWIPALTEALRCLRLFLKNKLLTYISVGHLPMGGRFKLRYFVGLFS